MCKDYYDVDMKSIKASNYLFKISAIIHIIKTTVYLGETTVYLTSFDYKNDYNPKLYFL